MIYDDIKNIRIQHNWSEGTHVSGGWRSIWRPLTTRRCPRGAALKTDGSLQTYKKNCLIGESAAQIGICMHHNREQTECLLRY